MLGLTIADIFVTIVFVKNGVVLSLICVVIVLFGAAAYLFGQNQKLSSGSPTVTIFPSVAPTISDESSNNSLPSPTQGATTQKAVIIIESQGSLPGDDAALLRSRIAEPYVLYHESLSEEQQVVSFKISVNTQQSKNDFPYLADAVLKNGGNEGFVISKKDGKIDWWFPECMIECQFTPQFSAKYPEIIAKSN